MSPLATLAAEHRAGPNMVAPPAPLSLKVVAKYPYRIVAAEPDYLWTLPSNRTLGRLDAAGKAYPGHVFPVGYQVVRMMTTSMPGVALASVANLATRKYAIYKTADGGVHVGANAPRFDDGRPVLRLGDTDGTEAQQIADVSVLTRGLAEVRLGGAKALLLVEYNANTARQRGGANDQVRLMKSLDNGSTWSELAHWNTNGKHNVRHGHVVSQNPVTGEIYVAFGDTDAESGLVAWDGVSGWTSNQNLANYAAEPGFHVLAGRQRFRVADVLYEKDALVITADAVGRDEAGVWRATHDLGSYQRLDHSISAHRSQMMWLGTTLSGRYYVVSGLAANCPDRWVYVFASDSPSTRWNIVGKLPYRAGSLGGLAMNFFAWRGKLYLRQDHLATSGTADTIVLEPATSSRKE